MLTHNVDTKHTISFSFRDEFHLTLGVEVGLRTRIRREGELANLVLHPSRLELLLGFADPGNLGMSVNNGGDSMVVNVTMSLLDVLGGGNALFFSLVCKHGAKSDVTDTLYVLDSRVELVVNDDTAFVIKLNTNLLKVKPLSVGSTANGDKDDIGFEL
jgi:hypothetical protein